MERLRKTWKTATQYPKVFKKRLTSEPQVAEPEVNVPGVQKTSLPPNPNDTLTGRFNHFGAIKRATGKPNKKK